MTLENFDAVLRLLQHTQPFRVFTIELNTGERFEVDHASALAVRDGGGVFVGPGGTPHWFDFTTVNQIIGPTVGSIDD